MSSSFPGRSEPKYRPTVRETWQRPKLTARIFRNMSEAKLDSLTLRRNAQPIQQLYITLDHWLLATILMKKAERATVNNAVFWDVAL
jgi:hypothetical protein